MQYWKSFVPAHWCLTFLLSVSLQDKRVGLHLPFLLMLHNTGRPWWSEDMWNSLISDLSRCGLWTGRRLGMEVGTGERHEMEGRKSEKIPLQFGSLESLICWDRETEKVRPFLCTRDLIKVDWRRRYSWPKECFNTQPSRAAQHAYMYKINRRLYFFSSNSTLSLFCLFFL